MGGASLPGLGNPRFDALGQDLPLSTVQAKGLHKDSCKSGHETQKEQHSLEQKTGFKGLRAGESQGETAIVV